MDCPLQVEILHPLTSVAWKECSKLPIKTRNAQAVWLDDRLYVGGGVTLRTYKSGTNKRSFRDAARLYTYLPEKDEWIKKPIDTPAYYFALTVYHSQLVIASGCEYKGADKVGPHTNKVWILTSSAQGGEKKWQDDEIPPMSIRRHSATGISSGDHLVVAGGLGINGIELKSVEVYNGHEWAPARELPRACWHMKCTLYNGCLYLMGGVGQGQKVYYIEINHLIMNCTAVSDLTPSSELDEKAWKKITSIPHERSALAAFGGSLVAIGGGDLFSPTSQMYAYAPGPAGNSPLQLWVHISSGDLPTSLISICAITLPSGELMSIGGEIGQEWSDRVFKASLYKDTPLDLDGQLCPNILSRLEAIGIPAPTELAKSHDVVSSSVSLPMGKQQTWRNFFQVLEEMKLHNLVQEIQKCLELVPSDVITPMITDDTSKQIAAVAGISDHTLKTVEDLAMDVKDEFAILKEDLLGHYLQFEENIFTTVDDFKCKQLRYLNEELVSITGLRGVSVCGETTLVISNSVAQHLEWKSFGLRVSAEEHSLPSGVDQCTIKVMVSTAGHYEFPENAHLVSGVFWFQCKPLCKFRKPITIEVQHCAKPENAAKLKFVKAFCTQKSLPYSFKYVEGGHFHASSSYGVLDLHSFSGIAITQEGSEDRLYCAKLYYLTPHILLPQEHQHGIDLVVSWEIDVHMKAIQKYYDEQGAQKGSYQQFDFDSEEVSLNIPWPAGVKLEEGWKLIPLTNPVIRKKQVDSYKPGRLTPKCELMVERQVEVAQQVMFILTLNRAKPPHVSFQIVLPGRTKGKASPSLKRSRSASSPDATQGTSAQFSKHRRLASDSATLSDRKAMDKSPTIDDLLRELGRVADKWENLGVLLKVPIHELTDIRTQQQNNSNRLREMLIRWRDPTWEDLVEALKADIIGEEQLASHLQSNYLVHAPPTGHDM